MTESHWRHRAAPIIRAVLKAHEGQPDSVIREALREAYPFGEREHHPYQIWCDEIKRQRGEKPPLGSRKPRQPDPRQAGLFYVPEEFRRAKE